MTTFWRNESLILSQLGKFEPLTPTIFLLVMDIILDPIFKLLLSRLFKILYTLFKAKVTLTLL